MRFSTFPEADYSSRSTTTIMSSWNRAQATSVRYEVQRKRLNVRLGDLACQRHNSTYPAALQLYNPNWESRSQSDDCTSCRVDLQQQRTKFRSPTTLHVFL
jgi:hypothetical protein